MRFIKEIITFRKTHVRQNNKLFVIASLSSSIFSSRYIAVHNPIDYKQSLNDSDAIKKRLAKYLLPVIIASILFNVPKFLEATYYVETIQVRLLV